MQVGDRIQVSDEILSLGFDLQPTVTLLGLIIENDTFSFNKSLHKLTEKIKNEIKFW